MLISISHPELLTISDENTNTSFFGADQEWYSAEWSRKAGCGPTCAANIMAYLALSRPELRSLYGYENMSHSNFTSHMEDIFRFVTPGPLGLNRVEMFSSGVTAYAESKGINLTPHVFEVQSNMLRNRPDVSQFINFTQTGLSSDCPLGFLNLTRGRVKNIQAWHWITITAADIGENSLIAYASDESKKISFDLRLWYQTTRMSGGLVYFT